jgi:hypothetical protein
MDAVRSRRSRLEIKQVIAICGAWLAWKYFAIRGSDSFWQLNKTTIRDGLAHRVDIAAVQVTDGVTQTRQKPNNITGFCAVACKADCV